MVKSRAWSNDKSIGSGEDHKTRASQLLMYGPKKL